jgi:hypothetical protein
LCRFGGGVIVPLRRWRDAIAPPRFGQAAEGSSKPVRDALREAEKKRQSAPVPPDLADDDEL